MLQSIAELQHLLEGTPLAQRDIALVPPAPGGDETVFAINVTGMDGINAWRLLRSVTDLTGRWPLLTLLHTVRTAPWEQQLEDADLFSRFYFEEEQRSDRSGDSPGQILAASAHVDVTAQLAQIPDDTDLDLETSRQETLLQYGTAPVLDDPAEFLDRAAIANYKQLEQWLLQWEIQHCAEALVLPEQELTYLDWYIPQYESHALLLMPSLCGWEAPAYLNWYASGRCNSQFIVALLREWHRQYGAELVAHYGTMLQFIVSRRPTTLEEAFELAWQHYTVAPCTLILPGVSVRNHARALLQSERWFLHERP